MKHLNSKILSTGAILAIGIVLVIQAMWLPSCSTDVGGDEDRTAPVVTIDAITDADDTDGEIIGEATIHWTTDEPNPSRVDIYLSSDSGESYDITVALDAPDTGSYMWDTNTVPDCRACRLRIIATDIVGNVSEPGDSSEDFVINNVPQVLGVAFYTDLSYDGPGSGDSIRVPFDKDLELLTSIASDIFFFPVLGDSIGAFATVEKSDKQNELVITFNELVPTDFHLHVRGQFDQERLHRTAPSGMNLRDNLALGILVAKDTGRTAASAENGIDIAPTFSGTGQPLGTSEISTVALGDVNGDGFPDIIAGNRRQPISVWLNSGRGVFTLDQELPGSSTMSVVLRDIDDDGDLDLICGNDSETEPNRIWENNGNGEFDIMYELQPPGITRSIALGDVNGDGNLDIVAGNKGKNQLWKQDDSGEFTLAQEIGDSDTWSIVLVDIDDDGDPDLIAGNAESETLFQLAPELNQVWRNDNGEFNDSRPLGNSSTKSVAFGDVDGDGDFDLVTGNYSYAEPFEPFQVEPNRVWLNNIDNLPDQKGTFTDSGQMLGNSRTMAVALDDLDGDGDLDIIAANNLDPSRVWLNNIGNMRQQRGVFSDSGEALPGSGTSSVEIGDVDGDGDPDLVFGNLHTKAVIREGVWLNSARTPDMAVFLDSTQALGDSDTRSVALGDVDGDGDLDIVAGNRDSMDRVWRNDDGAFNVILDEFGDSGRTTRELALGDVDGDDDLDIVTMHLWLSHRVWRNDDGVFNVILDEFGYGESNLSVALGDVDDDLDPDIITGNGGLNRVWRNDDGVFDVILDEFDGSSTWAVALGDVDGDNDPDVVSGNRFTSRVWENDNGEFNVILDEFGGDEAINSVALADIDDDLDPDIITGNHGGLNRVWRNDDGVFDVILDEFDGSDTLSVAIDDIDGDGDRDIITGNIGANRVWLNNMYNTPGQEGVFTEAGPGLGENLTWSVVLGDVDGDGDLDFVAGNDGKNRVWLNDY